MRPTFFRHIIHHRLHGTFSNVPQRPCKQRTSHQYMCRPSSSSSSSYACNLAHIPFHSEKSCRLNGQRIWHAKYISTAHITIHATMFVCLCERELTRARNPTVHIKIHSHFSVLPIRSANVGVATTSKSFPSLGANRACGSTTAKAYNSILFCVGTSSQTHISRSSSSNRSSRVAAEHEQSLNCFLNFFYSCLCVRRTSTDVLRSFAVIQEVDFLFVKSKKREKKRTKL